MSGTEVERMLDVPPGRTARVFPTGPSDGTAGFYRRTDAQHADVGVDPDGRLLEAYHWGEYTEGRPGQGLWVVLIPFGVVNAAQFMLPAALAGRRWAHAIAGACLRIVALVLTTLAVLGAAFMAMDRVAWRAVGDTGTGRWWALAVGALLPIVVLLWLRRIGSVRHQPGRSDLGRNPALDHDPEVPDRQAAWSAPPSAGAMAGAPGGLGSSYFYVGSPLTPARTDAPTLRNLHLAVAVALAAVLLAWPAATVDDGLARAARVIGLVVLGVLVGVTILLGDPEELASPRLAAGRWRTVRRRWHLVVFRATPWALGGAVGAFVVAEAAGIRLALRGATTSAALPEALPGVNGLAFVLLAVGLGAVLLLLVMCWIVGRTDASGCRERAYQRYAGGMTAGLATAVGLFLGIAYTGGVVTTFDFVMNVFWPLNGHPRDEIETWVALPNVVRHIEVAWVITVLISLVLAVVVVVRYRLLRGRLREAARRDFARPESGPVTLDPATLNLVAWRVFVARLKNLIPFVFALYAGSGVVLTVAAAADLQGWVRWFDRIPGINWWVLLGALVVVGLAATVVWVAKRSKESLGARRTANTVWDVISFWPRSIHPFVPVAYSQFVVADLRRRISEHVDHGRRVVLAGHSQGSLISLAALLWIPAHQRGRVGVVTFGSQIRQMFSRAFPAYVNTAVVTWVWDAYGPRWRNLYRDTDHLAGPALSWRHATTNGTGDSSCRWPGDADPDPARDVFVAPGGRRECGPDWRLLDPRVPTGDPTPTVAGSAQPTLHCHSDYWTDPDWPRAVAAVRSPGRTAPVVP